MQILQDEFGYGNYDVLDENQEMAFLLRHGWSLGLGPRSKLAKTSNYSQNCLAFLNSVSVVFDELIDIADLAGHNSDFAEKFQEYEALLDDHKLLTFGRMIRLAVNGLKSKPEAIRKYKHLVVDEYQDINRAQEQLIKLLAQRMTCTVVGDPRQCIYQWRGSDPTCFDRFVSDFPAETVEISENRRSGKAIVDAGNSVAKKFEEPQLRGPMMAVRKRSDTLFGGTALYVEHETSEDEARWIAEQIAQMVPTVCNYEEIAILLRSVSTSAPPIIEELKKRNIPYLVGGKVGLFKRDEAQAVGRIFAWCADADGFWQTDPYNQQSREQGDTILSRAIALWPGRAVETDLREFKGAIRSGRYKDLTNAYQELLILLGFLDWDPLETQVAARMANLGRFNTLLTDFESAKRRGGRRPNWPSDLKDLCWYMNTYAMGAYEEQPAEDLRGQPAIQVMTVHQAKGLEWPVVFIPALTNRRFPSANTGHPRSWLLSDALFDTRRYEGSINEERKLFYVATTRARDGLCISRFRRTNKNASGPSQFLTEIGIPRQITPQSPFLREIDRKAADEDEIVTYSATEIIEYLRCPQFYRLRNLWGYQPSLAQELGFGKSLHHVLRVLSERAKSGGEPLDDLDAVLDSDFHLPFAPAGTKTALQKTAKEKLENYIKNHLDEMKAVEEVEARLEFQLTKKATVTGRVDVIIGQHGERELRDYKTSDDSRSVDEAGLQLRLYALGLDKLGQSVASASIAAIMEGELTPVDVSTTSLQQAENSAAQAISGILSGQFIGRPCAFCKQCDYKSICRFKA